MDIHPWTKYEVARLRDEERLLRARAAMRAVELRQGHPTKQHAADTERTISWLDRVLRRGVVEQAPARSGAQ